MPNILHFIRLSLALNSHDLQPFTNIGHVLLHSSCPHPQGGPSVTQCNNVAAPGGFSSNTEDDYPYMSVTPGPFDVKFVGHV